MRVVFLFMSLSSAIPGSTPDDWKPTYPCHDRYHTDFEHEGYFKLFGDMVKRGLIKDLHVFYESNKGPGYAKWIDHPHAKCAVIPEIRFAEKYIQEDTIIFVRGGFKHWHDWLLKYKGKNWLVLYAANTGRGRWPWWDIVLDDIGMNLCVDKAERLLMPFIKPIDDTFFTPTQDNAVYDIMMGSSHIHDKKGQWRVFEVLKEYELLYGKRPNAILPGAPRRGVYTRPMIDSILSKEWDIPMPGHVSRTELKGIYNKSRIAMFLGAHGQNDRGPLEALACGTPVMLGSPKYHSCALRKMPGVLCLDKIHQYKTIAKILSFLDSRDKQSNKTLVALEFRRRLGYQNCLDRMMYMFVFIYGTAPSIENKKALCECFRRAFYDFTNNG